MGERNSTACAFFKPFPVLPQLAVYILASLARAGFRGAFVSRRSFGSVFGALCFARAVRGARHALVDRGRRDGRGLSGAWA